MDQRRCVSVVKSGSITGNRIESRYKRSCASNYRGNAYKSPVIVISEFRCYFFDGLKGKPVASTTLFSKGGDTKDKPISMFRSVVAVVPTSKAKAFCVRPVVRRFVLTALPISFRNAWVTCTPLCIMSSGVFSGVAITGASTDWVSVNAVEFMVSQECSTTGQCQKTVVGDCGKDFSCFFSKFVPQSPVNTKKRSLI